MTKLLGSPLRQCLNMFLKLNSRSQQISVDFFVFCVSPVLILRNIFSVKCPATVKKQTKKRQEETRLLTSKKLSCCIITLRNIVNIARELRLSSSTAQWSTVIFFNTFHNQNCMNVIGPCQFSLATRSNGLPAPMEIHIQFVYKCVSK